MGTANLDMGGKMGFSEDFVWGAAASSYQIEGAAYEDGKGPSIWDMLCRQPGRIWAGSSGDVACDHYHRYQEDVRLMSHIGLKAYRFSVSWPRVLPEGVKAVNESGLAFYDRLVDALLENGIQPWVTLFHWDYPYSLFCRGGWLNRDSADWFAEYTAVVVDRLSDRVAHWLTLNEPEVHIGLGHRQGEHAPGLKLGLNDVLLAAHHTLLAHGKAVQVIRARAKVKPVVGTAMGSTPCIPATDNPADIEAARACMFSVAEKHGASETWFAAPMFLGHYPKDELRSLAAEMPAIQDGDMGTICQPLDFYGVNIYEGLTVGATSDGGYESVRFLADAAVTAMGWPVTPEALYWGPRFLYERYGLPIVITENGMANCDWVGLDGSVHDPQRVDFLTRYLRAYRRAVEDGVVAKGYFAWSILDNFEWTYGYKRRFGLVWVDFAAQQRILKDSAHWYGQVIASNGEILDAGGPLLRDDGSGD